MDTIIALIICSIVAWIYFSKDPVIKPVKPKQARPRKHLGQAACDWKRQQIRQRIKELQDGQVIGVSRKYSATRSLFLKGFIRGADADAYHKD